MLQEWSLSGQGTMTTSGLAHRILLELFWRNLAGPSCINKNQQSYDLWYSEFAFGSKLKN